MQVKINFFLYVFLKGSSIMLYIRVIKYCNYTYLRMRPYCFITRSEPYRSGSGDYFTRPTTVVYRSISYQIFTRRSFW